MKALILAAGYAKRLWPMTKNKPKPLLEVKGKKIIEHITDQLNEVKELDEILVITNEKFSLPFEQWAEEYESNLPVRIINDLTLSNDDRLGAVGDMHYTIKEANLDDELMVIAGDNLFEYKIKDFYNYFKEKNASVVACRDMGRKEEVAGKFGVVEIDDSKKITGFEEKPENPSSSLAATACYIFTKEDVNEIIKYVDVGNPTDDAGDFIKWLSNHKEVFAFVFKEKWFDIGSFENLGKAREEYNGP